MDLNISISPRGKYILVYIALLIMNDLTRMENKAKIIQKNILELSLDQKLKLDCFFHVVIWCTHQILC